jgi:hypothetical protein
MSVCCNRWCLSPRAVPRATPLQEMGFEPSVPPLFPLWAALSRCGSSQPRRARDVGIWVAADRTNPCSVTIDSGSGGVAVAASAFLRPRSNLPAEWTGSNALNKA